MYRKLLNSKFFRDNPIVDMSPQRFVCLIVFDEGLEEATSEFMLNDIPLSDKRRADISAEKAEIAKQDNPEAIFRLLRQPMDTLSRPALAAKALEYEDDIVPMIIEKLIRNDHDTFIENAITILARAKGNYSEQIRSRYPDFRSSYVKSLICIYLGYKAPEDVIPWMMERFFEMKKLYPEETYNQGPLLALCELEARYYT